MEKKVMLITGTSKGIGKYLAGYYLGRNYFVVGCSRSEPNITDNNYRHFCLDISDETSVKKLFRTVQKEYDRLDVLINNAGIASMNSSILTPVETARRILDTNFIGTFLFCREGAKLMMKRKYGRIINFSTVAVPLELEGEAIYASSKAAIVTLTAIMAKELASFGISVNAVGPAPTKTDLIKSIPEEKINALLEKLKSKRFGELSDISDTIDMFIEDGQEFITGKTIYLGGIS